MIVASSRAETCSPGEPQPPCQWIFQDGSCRSGFNETIRRWITRGGAAQSGTTTGKIPKIRFQEFQIPKTCGVWKLMWWNKKQDSKRFWEKHCFWQIFWQFSKCGDSICLVRPGARQSADVGMDQSSSRTRTRWPCNLEIWKYANLQTWINLAGPWKLLLWV